MRGSPLRRIVLSAAATVATVVAMLALKPHTAPDEPPDVQAAAPETSAAASPSATPSQRASAGRPSRTVQPSPSPSRTGTAGPPRDTAEPEPRPAEPTASRTSSKPPPEETETSQPPPEKRSVTGASADTKYGPVQVKITLTGDRITAAAAVQCTDSTPRSEEICQEAVPELNAAAVAAQSADIDTVSGATYTSDGYRQSLQSAIDKAGI